MRKQGNVNIVTGTVPAARLSPTAFNVTSDLTSSKACVELPVAPGTWAYNSFLCYHFYIYLPHPPTPFYFSIPLQDTSTPSIYTIPLHHPYTPSLYIYTIPLHHPSIPSLYTILPSHPPTPSSYALLSSYALPLLYLFLCPQVLSSVYPYSVPNTQFCLLLYLSSFPTGSLIPNVLLSILYISDFYFRQYRDKDTGDCTPCSDSHCHVCTPKVCVECDSSYNLYKGSCVSECSSNTYVEKSREGTAECFEWVKNDLLPGERNSELNATSTNLLVHMYHKLWKLWV